MTKNVGWVDRTVRVAVGLFLIAFALSFGFPQTGWNWIGWIGIIPIITGLFGMCPIYRLLGVSTAYRGT